MESNGGGNKELDADAGGRKSVGEGKRIMQGGMGSNRGGATKLLPQKNIPF